MMPLMGDFYSHPVIFDVTVSWLFRSYWVRNMELISGWFGRFSVLFPGISFTQ